MTSRPNRTPLLVLIVVTAVAGIALVAIALAQDDSDPATRPAGTGTGSSSAGFRGSRLPAELSKKPAPSFRLRDGRGGVIDTDQLKGKPYALTFLFTDCRDVCPLIGVQLRQALELLDDPASVNIVAISVDPEGDTQANVRRWLRRHQLPRNFRYAIGTEDKLRPIWEGYFAAPQVDGVPESTHTASIWLIDSQGRRRTRFSAGEPVHPEDIAHDLRRLTRDQQGPS